MKTEKKASHTPGPYIEPPLFCRRGHRARIGDMLEGVCSECQIFRDLLEAAKEAIQCFDDIGEHYQRDLLRAAISKAEKR